MIDWARLHEHASGAPALQTWITALQKSEACTLDPKRYGDLPRWQKALDSLPSVADRTVELDRDAPRVVLEGLPTEDPHIRDNLQALHPWRKGPFDVNGTLVDAEWRSDQKWQRIAPHLSSLQDRRVLDVGCGNGYFCLRLLGSGARLALGLDPSPLFNVQFAALKKLYGECAAHLLPLPDTALEAAPACFDTALSMGVLYHRKSPFDHLGLLHNALRPGGELLLETLVIDGDVQQVLVPEGRYARMRNVWFLPSAEAMSHWLTRAGFQDVRCVDTSATTESEQRTTDWMRFESHAQALDPDNPDKTIEGLPAPKRAAFIATRPIR